MSLAVMLSLVFYGEASLMASVQKFWKREKNVIASVEEPESADTFRVLPPHPRRRPPPIPGAPVVVTVYEANTRITTVSPLPNLLSIGHAAPASLVVQPVTANPVTVSANATNITTPVQITTPVSITNMFHVGLGRPTLPVFNIVAANGVCFWPNATNHTSASQLLHNILNVTSHRQITTLVAMTDMFGVGLGALAAPDLNIFAVNGIFMARSATNHTSAAGLIRNILSRDERARVSPVVNAVPASGSRDQLIPNVLNIRRADPAPPVLAIVTANAVFVTAHAANTTLFAPAMSTAFPAISLLTVTPVFTATTALATTNLPPNATIPSQNASQGENWDLASRCLECCLVLCRVILMLFCNWKEKLLCWFPIHGRSSASLTRRPTISVCGLLTDFTRVNFISPKACRHGSGLSLQARSIGAISMAFRLILHQSYYKCPER